MSRRFMITRPKPCCGSLDRIYEVFEFTGYESIGGICRECGHITNMWLLKTGLNRVVDECRIIWLDDPDISSDTIQEIEDKLKV